MQKFRRRQFGHDLGADLDPLIKIVATPLTIAHCSGVLLVAVKFK